jgi:hypothetical protein
MCRWRAALRVAALPRCGRWCLALIRYVGLQQAELRSQQLAEMCDSIAK